MKPECANLAMNKVNCALYFQDCPYNEDWDEAKLCCVGYSEE